MLGAIKKTRMFSDVRPDIKAISLVARMKSTHDDGLLSAFAGLLEKDGIMIKSSTFLLPYLLAEEGCWTKRKPSRAEKSDIDLGWHIAKEIGRLDIGQCVFLRQEDGTEPTAYILLNDDNGNKGVVWGCTFPSALAGGKNLVSTGLIWTGNLHTGGHSTTQPS